MTNEEFLEASACFVAWNAAGSYGINGMLAVLFTLRNRAEKTDWVAALDVLGDTFTQQPDPRNPDFYTLLQAVHKVFSGEAEDKLSNGATQWWWDRDKERCAVIGGLTLYK